MIISLVPRCLAVWLEPGHTSPYELYQFLRFGPRTASIPIENATACKLTRKAVQVRAARDRPGDGRPAAQVCWAIAPPLCVYFQYAITTGCLGGRNTVRAALHHDGANHLGVVWDCVCRQLTVVPLPEIEALVAAQAADPPAAAAAARLAEEVTQVRRATGTKDNPPTQNMDCPPTQNMDNPPTQNMDCPPTHKWP